MVCDRCKTAVKSQLEQLGLHPETVMLGEVGMGEAEIPQTKLKEIENALAAIGFELLEDRKSRLIEKIKNVVIELVHHNPIPSKLKHSVLISRELHHDYPYLSNLFSEIEGITIEHYIIQQKVEKIKEYIAYDELTLSEIADKMGYSSSAHLSAQFKKATGLPPSHFKSRSTIVRKSLNEVGNS